MHSLSMCAQHVGDELLWTGSVTGDWQESFEYRYAVVGGRCELTSARPRVESACVSFNWLKVVVLQCFQSHRFQVCQPAVPAPWWTIRWRCSSGTRWFARRTTPHPVGQRTKVDAKLESVSLPGFQQTLRGEKRMDKGFRVRVDITVLST